MPSYEEATKVYHYEVAGKRYRKVTFGESVHYEAAKQFTYNDGKSLGWFVPLDAKPQPTPAAPAPGKPA